MSSYLTPTRNTKIAVDSLYKISQEYVRGTITRGTLSPHPSPAQGDKHLTHGKIDLTSSWLANQSIPITTVVAVSLNISHHQQVYNVKFPFPFLPFSDKNHYTSTIKCYPFIPPGNCGRETILCSTEGCLVLAAQLFSRAQRAICDQDLST